MSRPRHYSPALDRFLVCALYHEARHRKLPMTALANGLLAEQLQGTAGWRQAEEQRQRQEHISSQQPPTTATPNESNHHGHHP
jgi:6-phosphogluconolactonase (cycloisomerase 2 family)